MPTSLTVSTAAELATALQSFDIGGDNAAVGGAGTIVLGGSITLTDVLPAINLPEGASLEVIGNGYTIDGAGTYPGLFLWSGSLSLQDLAINNAVARGLPGENSDGAFYPTGAGGGGAGLGGGLFVASAGTATLSNVQFQGDSAIGGKGGSRFSNGQFGTGAGGGMAPRGMVFPGGFGSAGGFGGGGNGGGFRQIGQNGGFGGGGGSGGIEDYRARTYAPQSPGNGIYGFGANVAQGGYGGGEAGGEYAGKPPGEVGLAGALNPSGGGGLGGGADVFVQSGGVLALQTGGSNVLLGAGTVRGGESTYSAFAGRGLGSSMFLQGVGTVRMTAEAGQTIDIAGSIAGDEGTFGLLVNGAGTVRLEAGNSFKGGIEVSSGTLDLAKGALGSGGLTVSGGATIILRDAGALDAAILGIDQGSLAAPAGTAYTIVLADAIDLTQALHAIILANGATLNIVGGGNTIDGGHTLPGLLVDEGAVTLSSLTLANLQATGASGQRNGNSTGGGAAGLGGALFISASGQVTLSDVNFSGNGATGGAGGDQPLGNYTNHPDGATMQRAAYGGTSLNFGSFGVGGIADNVADRYGRIFGGAGGYGGGGGGGFGIGGRYGGGLGGTGGGAGMRGGGGGLGAGGNIYLQPGAGLTITTTAGADIAMGAGSAIGGSGGNFVVPGGNYSGFPGQSWGGSIAQGGTAPVRLSPVAGSTLHLDGEVRSIGGLIVDGAGTVDISGMSIVNGGPAITLRSGTLVFTGPSGPPLVTLDGVATVRIDSDGGSATRSFVGIALGDTIDLRYLPFAAGAAQVNAVPPGFGSTITQLTASSGTVSFAAQIPNMPAGTALVAGDDGQGGTALVLRPVSFSVGDAASLAAAINTISLGGASSASGLAYTITLTAAISIDSALPAIDLAGGGALTIDGNGHGLTVPAGLGVTAGALTLKDIALAGSGPVLAAGSGPLASDGSVTLGSAASFAGETRLHSGTLEIAAGAGTGSGPIRFTGDAVLRLDGTVVPGNTINGFGLGDSIDFAGLGFVAGTTQASLSGGTLSVSNGTTTLSVALGAIPDGLVPLAIADGNGATAVVLDIPTATVSDSAGFAAAIDALNTSAVAGQSYRIAFANPITLSADLPAIDLPAGVTLDISGGGATLDGDGNHPGLLVWAGNVTIEDLAITGTRAQGGAAPDGQFPGGGGAGLGGGLFVAAGATVSLGAVAFSGNAARGGAGGSFVLGGPSSGDGGGLGRPGPVGGGSFGEAGGTTSGHYAGGFGAGGGGIAGGAGGFGGGGGSGYYVTGGAGGFGAGAGRYGAPGLGGGGGGGGLGAGGDVFVQEGGALVLLGGSVLGMGQVLGGAGGLGDVWGSGPAGADGGGGLGLGTAMFLQGAQTVTLAPAIGTGLTIAGEIADDGGLASLRLTGAGTVTLSAANSFGGGIVLAAGTLALGRADAGGTGAITFTEGAQTLRLAGTLMPDNPLTGFGAGDVIDLPDLTFGASGTATVEAGNTLAITTTGGTASLVLGGNAYAGVHFSAHADGSGGTAIEIACFASGTRIATERGEVTVEELRPGDRAIHATGGSGEIVWIGHRRVNCARHPRPWDVMPVRVAAHAFGLNQPAADLLLSPDHAVFVDGVLIPVRYLVNDATILQEEVEAITYWHVELAAHAAILAEGLPCESYLDTGNRDAFDNAAATALQPRFAPRDRVAWAEGACAPLVESGPRLEHVRALLAAYAGARLPEAETVLLPAAGVVRAVIAPGACRVHLVSNGVVPPGERRRLGAAIGGLTLDGAVISLASPMLAGGFHGVEGGWRWTNGEGVLLLPPSEVARELAVEVVMLCTVEAA